MRRGVPDATTWRPNTPIAFSARAGSTNQQRSYELDEVRSRRNGIIG